MSDSKSERLMWEGWARLESVAHGGPKGLQRLWYIVSGHTLNLLFGLIVYAEELLTETVESFNNTEPY